MSLFISSMPHVLIVADSRGRYLDDFIKHKSNKAEEWEAEVVVLPEAPLTHVCDAIYSKLKETLIKFCCVVVVTGICSFTQKITHLAGGTELAYLPVTSKNCTHQINTTKNI